MKKFCLTISAILIVIIAVSISVFNQTNNAQLLKANVKALAQITVPIEGEHGGDCKCYNKIKTCYTEDQYGNKVVDNSRFVLYCGTCTYIPGKPAFLSSTGVCAGVEFNANI